MKFRILASAALIAVLASACQKTESSSSLTTDDSAQADSMMYYFGQMRAIEYLHEAEQDTTLLTKQSKDDYIRGLRAGLKAIKYNKDAYNNGVFLGIQMAMNMNQFKDEYGVPLSEKVLIESVSKALSSDSTIDASEVQRNFYQIMATFNAEKDARDKEAAKAAMKAKAEELGMVFITENLYSAKPKTIKENPFKEGDNVIMNLKVSDADGNPVSSPFPQEVSLGARLRENPLMDAILMLESGENGKYITTAGALFGQRASQLKLKQSDVVILDMTPELIKNEDAE